MVKRTTTITIKTITRNSNTINDDNDDVSSENNYKSLGDDIMTITMTTTMRRSTNGTMDDYKNKSINVNDNNNEDNNNDDNHSNDDKNNQKQRLF